MFTFDVDPEDLFNERAAQMNAWGIPARLVREIRASIRDNWSSGPGGWCYEWSLRARDAEQSGQWRLAAALWGGARFPVACTDERRAALARQVACFLKAAPDFPIAFERRTVVAGDVSLPVHLYTPRGRGPHPVMVLSGGVDTYKMELHRLAVILCRAVGARIAAIDMPGTGETPGPLEPDSDRVYSGVLDAIAGDRPVQRGIFGISFGGHWAAKLALTDRVDAAVDMGGPIGAVPIDRDYVLRLPNGMTGIVANAMGLSRMPTLEQAERLIASFSLAHQGLLAHPPSPLPLIALNGVGDLYLPAGETLVFDRLNGAEAWLFTHGDHCAANLMKRYLPAAITFLRRKLHGETTTNRALDRMARWLLPARSASLAGGTHAVHPLELGDQMVAQQGDPERHVARRGP